MKPHIFVLRAIGSEFALSFIKPIAIILAIVLAVVIGVVWLLTALFSPWWWLLAVPFAVIGGVIGAVLLISYVIVRVFRPELSKEQHMAVRGFIDKVSGLNEAARTPYPLLVARIAIDFIIHRDGRYVKGLINDSRSLKSEYTAILGYFSSQK